MASLLKINDNLARIEHTENPLSADVFVITHNDHTYFFDVGNNEEFLPIMQSYGKATIVLSHFHLDHIGSIAKVDCGEIYLSKHTFGYIHQGIIVTEKQTLENGFLELIPLTSSHSDGSLALNVNHEYCLVGDALYTKEKNGKSVYNVQKLNELIKQLNQIDTQYFVVSHEDEIKTKEQTLMELKTIYNRRQKNEAFIEMQY